MPQTSNVMQNPQTIRRRILRISTANPSPFHSLEISIRLVVHNPFQSQPRIHTRSPHPTPLGRRLAPGRPPGPPPSSPLLRMCERRYARCKDQARMMIEGSLDQTLNACIIPWIVTTHIYFTSAPNMMSQTKFWIKSNQKEYLSMFPYQR